MPRFDAEPVFGSLLDEPKGGSFLISSVDDRLGSQRYLPNTNVLETTFEASDGSFRVVDFAPRFELYGRMFRPTQIIRIVEPISGTPRIRVGCNPVLGWSQATPERVFGSHHVEFLGYSSRLRLTTDAPLSYLNGESFALTEARHFVLTWGAPIEEPLEPLCRRFLDETEKYWRTWVKHCEIPPLYQDAVIRSALTLKLHCFEDTGAIVASVTTSIPEAPGTGRTWDYRYCWLRDSYYTLGAFRLLGHFEEREQFLQYLMNIAASAPDLDLAPLYRIDGKSNLDETTLSHWAGFENERPVRIGNAAAKYQQHDVYGELVLALTPLFLDARFREAVTPSTVDLVRRLTEKAIAVAGKPDAGIWEIRSAWRPQTFSALMCWAAADRMASIASHLSISSAAQFAASAEFIKRNILTLGLHPQGQYLVADFGGLSVDAALLQAVTLRFLPTTDPRLGATVDAIQKELAHYDWIKRYKTDDGLGVPSTAFMLCTFWLIEALAKMGNDSEARRLMDLVLTLPTPLGLLAEDYEPVSKRMWGNFPQAYSHVGMIHAAFAASPRWMD